MPKRKSPELQKMTEKYIRVTRDRDEVAKKYEKVKDELTSVTLERDDHRRAILAVIKRLKECDQGLIDKKALQEQLDREIKEKRRLLSDINAQVELTWKQLQLTHTHRRLFSDPFLV
jgi:uncharacterized coiled-coil DUF342 family protein